MTPLELASYYQALLIIQYHAKTKAGAMVNLFTLEEIANMLINAVQDGFDIDTAVGAQLDILAKYVGAQRTIYSLDNSKTYFQFRDQADPPPPTEVQNGFADQSAPNTPWFWLRPSDLTAVTAVLTDGQLRQMIHYLATLESMELSLENIDNLLFATFGTFVTLVDHEDMTMTLTHNATLDPSPLFSFINTLKFLPRPAGVQLTVVEI